MRSSIIPGIISFVTHFAGAQAPLPQVVPPYVTNVNGPVSDGYIFTSVMDNANQLSNWPTTLMIMDQEGGLVFYLPKTNATQAPYQRKPSGTFQIHPDGRMSFTNAAPGPQAGVYIMDSTFAIIDTIKATPPYVLDGHDFEISDDGHYHILATEDRIMDASSMTSEIGPAGDTNCLVTGHLIQEFDENKILINEWKSLDHFALEDVYDSLYFLQPDVLEHSHMNSLQVDYEGNYVVSSRSLHEITRINRQTGDIIWRFGGKNNQFTIIGDTTPFTAQHDAQFYPGGKLVLFDNATNTSPHPVARMLVYILDTAAMTATLDYSREHDLGFYTQFMGSARQLSMDHKMICWGGGYDYAQGKSFQEFDAVDNEILSVDFEIGWVPYRAVKKEIPWSINRPIIACDQGTYSLASQDVYSSYLWSTGDTTQSITITLPGTYQLWVNAGAGFLSSIPFEVSDVNNMCQIGSLEELNALDFQVYPNPANEMLNIFVQGKNNIVAVKIYDLQGRALKTAPIEFTNGYGMVDVHALLNGTYYISLKDKDGYTIHNRRIQVLR